MRAKFLTLLLSLLLVAGVTKAQPMVPMPTFKGGDLQSFHSWVQRNAQVPKDLKKDKGQTQIVFYVNSEGVVEQVQVLKTTNEELAEIYRKTVESSPKWKPAKQKGKAVGVRIVLPPIQHR